MVQIHLVEGPVGAGKTTFAAKLREIHDTPPLVLDDWMVNLFSPDKPSEGLWEWYAERKGRCTEQIWKVACGLLNTGNDAILELGLIQRQSRLQFYKRIKAAGFDYRVYVLETPIEERRSRVAKRNLEKGDTFAMEVPEDIFELASQMWEPPDESEISAHNIQIVDGENTRAP